MGRKGGNGRAFWGHGWRCLPLAEPLLMVTIFILAFASGQMILIPDQKLETCEVVRALLLRDGYEGYEVTTADLWDRQLKEVFDKYIGQAWGALAVECLLLD